MQICQSNSKYTGACSEGKRRQKFFFSAQSPYHEIPDRSVEDCPIIVAFFAQTDEILSSFGNLEERLCRYCFIKKINLLE